MEQQVVRGACVCVRGNVLIVQEEEEKISISEQSRVKKISCHVFLVDKLVYYIHWKIKNLLLTTLKLKMQKELIIIELITVIA